MDQIIISSRYLRFIMIREDIPSRFLLSRSLLPAVGYHRHNRILPFDYCCEKKEDESRKEEEEASSSTVVVPIIM